jgi:hypothetical protein
MRRLLGWSHQPSNISTYGHTGLFLSSADTCHVTKVFLSYTHTHTEERVFKFMPSRQQNKQQTRTATCMYIISTTAVLKWHMSKCLNFQSALVTMYTPTAIWLRNSAFCPQSVFEGLMLLSQTTVIACNSPSWINWAVVIMVTVFFLCQAGTELPEILKWTSVVKVLNRCGVIFVLIFVNH